MLKFGILPYDEDRGTGFMRHAVVRVGHTTGEVLVTLVTNGQQFPGAKSFCRELVRRCPFITTVVQNINERQTNVVLGQREQVLFGPGFILDTLCGLTFRISSQSFYQVNATQTEVLYRQAIELAGFTGAEHAMDAYCGTGTIGLVAASMGAAQVTGVDCVESSIRDARQNARHNGVDNARFAVADAGAFMRDMAAQAAAAGRAGTDEEGRPLVLLMDPPRAGSTEEFLRAAVQLAPERIAYISCNPETQVRDLGFLKAIRLRRANGAARGHVPAHRPHRDHRAHRAHVAATIYIGREGNGRATANGERGAAAGDAGLGADAVARPKDVLAAARRCIEQRAGERRDARAAHGVGRLGLHGAGVRCAATGR